MTPAFQVEHLTRRLPSGDKVLTILENVTFSIARGQFAAIVGRSGSGKSTLLALMAGLDRPTEGSVRIDGTAIETLSEDALAILRREKIGFVFQAFHLLPNLTAIENVMLPVELSRGGNGKARQRAAELLAQVGLKERTHHYPSQLSGGEQQRVALARAFAAAPPMLLADEPTGNLDAENGAMVMEILTNLRRDHGTTLVLVTHDAGVAERADRRIFLASGRIASDTGAA